MRKLHISLILIFLSAIIATALTGCRDNSSDNGERTYCQELRSVRKLVLARMTLSKMATIEDIHLSEAQGLKQTASAILAAIKPGTRKAAYSYDTFLRAYVDLGTLSPDDVKLSADGKYLDITLPPVKVEFTGRDMEIREDHYRVTGLRSNIDADERARLKEEMNTVLKEEVRRNPAFAKRLTETAKSKARTYFDQWGAAHGMTVTVNFK